jgi:outer membrane protein assembly factor BamE
MPVNDHLPLQGCPSADRTRTRPAGAPSRSLCAAVAVAALIAVAGCGTSRQHSSGLFEAYKIDLPQGNYVTREMLDKVTPGMSREQVRFTLGSPLLNPLFRPDRWDYVFRYQYASGKAELRRVVILFTDDKVASVKADELPLRDDTSDPALPGYTPPAPRN